MTTLLEGAKRLLGRKGDLGAQVNGLDQAVRAGEGRLDESVLEPAATVVQRVHGRLRLSAEHSIVALAGATGSGKSSTFNALTGLELAAVGVRRPTTSWASACIWGPNEAEEVLDWLEIPPRHRTRRDSMLDVGKGSSELTGLVLLDLPDHDSTEVSHHLEVDRLIVLADLMVWVLDPQKYADAAIHNRFLKPLAAHKDVMIVVLNHIDQVPVERRESMLGDVRRLLVEDGLDGVPVLGISARHGEGLEQLRALIAERVADKKNQRARFRTDVQVAAERLAAANGTGAPREVSAGTRAELNDAVAESAGVPVVVDAVRRAATLRNTQATGWPLVKWLGKLRPDPLKRLHLDLGASGKDLIGQARSSLPPATQVQRSRVDSAVRRVADETSEGMTRPWVQSIRRASVSRAEDLADGVDKAVAQTPLGLERVPFWCRLVQFLQYLFLLAALVGGGWLLALIGAGYLQFDLPPAPKFDAGTGQVNSETGFPVPTLLLIIGLLAGFLLAALSRVLVTWGARSKSRQAERRMRAAIGEVTEELVLAPIATELTAYREVREGLDAALR